MDKRIVIKDGIVLYNGKLEKIDVSIKNSKIENIQRNLLLQEGDKIIDAKNKLVLPGMIDAHCHPFYLSNYESFSMSEASGGITTVIFFIGAIPQWNYRNGDRLIDTVKRNADEASKSSVLDFSFHVALNGNVDFKREIPEVIRAGIPSFKIIMAYSKRGLMLRTDQIYSAMEVIGENNGLAVVHAENGEIIDYLENKFILEGKVSNEYYLKSRPNFVESEAIYRAGILAQMASCPLHVVHVTNRESVKVVEEFRERKLNSPIFTETSTHYLTFTNDEVLQRGVLAKVGPPLREKEDKEILWEAINSGVIDVIGSDEFAVIKDEREQKKNNIFESPFGFPGEDAFFKVFYSQSVNGGKLNIIQVAKVFSENPAKIFGLYPQKGIIKKGSDADLTIIDPNKEETISSKNKYTVADYNIFEGYKILGVPILTMQRGKIVMKNGDVIAKPGQGQFVVRNLKYSSVFDL